MSAAERRTNSQPGRTKRTRFRSIGIIGILIAVIVLIIGLHHDSHGLKANQSSKQLATKPAVPPSTTSHSDAALNQLIAAWAGNYSFDTSVVVTELTGAQRTASYNATASVVPASTYKIYVAYATLHAVEKGTYSLSTVTDDGNTVQTDLNNMILNSDNDAARTLGFLYGWKNIDALLASQGITHTDLYNYVPPSTQPQGDKHTTAQDLATILQKLSAGSLLNQSHTQMLLGLMKNQHYRERIPSGVPSGVAVADKPGWLDPSEDTTGVYIENDAAIVYGPKSTYILVIMTDGSQTQPLANLSQQIYNYLEN